MMTLIEDLKQATQEMPWFVATVALLVLMAIGVNAEIFDAADGNEARLCVARVDTPAVPELVGCEQMAHRCPMETTPGVTVLLGVHHYRLEVTVPEAVVRSRLASVRMNLGYARPALHGVFGHVKGECRG